MKQCKRKGPPRETSGSSSFPVINTSAAGVDVGSEEQRVAQEVELFT